MAGISGYGKLPLRNQGVKSQEQIKEQPKVDGEKVDEGVKTKTPTRTTVSYTASAPLATAGPSGTEGAEGTKDPSGTNSPSELANLPKMSSKSTAKSDALRTFKNKYTTQCAQSYYKDFLECQKEGKFFMHSEYMHPSETYSYNVNGTLVKVKCSAQMVVGNSGASYKYNSPEILDD